MSTQQPVGHQDDVPLIQIWVTRFCDAVLENLKFVVLLVVVVAGVYGAYSIMQSRSYESAATAWSKFGNAQSAADYGEVAKEFSGSEVGLWARVAEGEAELSDGIRLQFTDRKSAEAELKKAGEAFDTVIKSGSAPAVALERAYLGKARYLEATSDGTLDDALEAYKSFTQKYPNSIYKDIIEARVKELSKPESKDFYAWFSKLNPKPEDRRNPRDGLPSGHPDINAPITLPQIPEELYPANWSELQEGADETKQPAASTDKPATDKPADAKPTAEKPADAKPEGTDAKKPEEKKAEDKKPDDTKAEDKPADEKKPDAAKTDAPAK